MGKRSFNSSEAAKYCHVSPDTIRDWANRGLLKSFRTPGGHRRIKREDLIAFLKEQNMPVDPELSGHSKRILVVDNEDIVADAVARLVSQIDGRVEVEVACSGFDAGRLLQSFQPDIVVIDLKMPGIDGFEVCRQIKDDPKTKHIVVIGMTGHYSEEEAAEIVRLGATTCLFKPIAADTLRGALDGALQSTLT